MPDVVGISKAILEADKVWREYKELKKKEDELYNRCKVKLSKDLEFRLDIEATLNRRELRVAPILERNNNPMFLSIEELLKLGEVINEIKGSLESLMEKYDVVHGYIFKEKSGDKSE